MAHAESPAGRRDALRRGPAAHRVAGQRAHSAGGFPRHLHAAEGGAGRARGGRDVEQCAVAGESCASGTCGFVEDLNCAACGVRCAACGVRCVVSQCLNNVDLFNT